jgi:hypothetical protein
MKIYCWSCGCNHHFTNGEAEKLLYVLQAELAEGNESAVSNDPMDNMECLLAHEALADDAECYREHTESLIGCRRDGEGIARAEQIGEGNE